MDTEVTRVRHSQGTVLLRRTWRTQFSLSSDTLLEQGSGGDTGPPWVTTTRGSRSFS